MRGDRCEVLRTEVLRHYPFPEYDGENFLTEGILYNRLIRDKVRIRWYDEPLEICEYRQGGLTQSGLQKFIDNPKGYATYIREDICSEEDRKGIFYDYYLRLKDRLSLKEIADNLGIGESDLLEKMNMQHMIKQIEQITARVIREAEGIYDGAGFTHEITSEWQKEFMDLGELLEANGYEDTDVIHELEVLCEICFQLSETQGDPNLLKRSLLISCKELLYHFFYSKKRGMHSLSVTSIIKNEPDILEWIEYHRLVGVDHFYLYDNESTDGLEEKLKSYIDAGIVTYTYFPGKAMQDKSVNDAISKYAYDTKYLAVIDGDEYIVPVEAGRLLPDLLDEIIEKYHKSQYHPGGFAGGVGINWRDYGTGGHKEPVEGLCIANYLYRGEDDYYQNVHIKTIYNPRVVSYVDNPHNGHYRNGYYTISEHGSMIPFLYFYDGHCDLLRINHYFSKSEAQVIEKNRRGWPVGDLKRDDKKELYEASVNCNKVYDPIMLRYVDEVTKSLKEGLS